MYQWHQRLAVANGAINVISAVINDVISLAMAACYRRQRDVAKKINDMWRKSSSKSAHQAYGAYKLGEKYWHGARKSMASA